ncbi:MAG: prepilin-type N-terminal cleavage/methylation domain-containing protein [Candidatus Omnitrophica bacterium]|nr:prepilin-type N-terminal cleavage/methylation domain-containing protein [Candidatus Omnitrophota bacterium]
MGIKIQKRFSASFTLLELIIVMIILGLIASLAIPRYQNLVEKARSVEGVNVLNNIFRAQERYVYLSNGSYSTEVSELNLSIPAMTYFDQPALDPAGGTISSPPEYLGSIGRKGGLYTLYIYASGDIKCAQGEGIETNYCNAMGYAQVAQEESGEEGGGSEDPPPPSSCFPAGVKITMADNSSKNIEEIKVGDLIQSYDTEKGIYIPGKVVKLDFGFTVGGHKEACASLGNEPALYTINNGLVEFTPEHPFWVKEEGQTKWAALVPDLRQHPQTAPVESIKLKAGQEILVEGKWIRIENISVSREGIPEVKVYNFMVEGTNIYIANGIVVHNKTDGEDSEPGGPIPPLANPFDA